MSKAIDTLLNAIYAEIPQEILELTFKRTGAWQVQQTNLDSHITKRVVTNRLLKDCNLVSGKLKYIPLHISYHVPTETETSTTGMMMGQYSLYRIPPEERDNRPIADVVQVNPPGTITAGSNIPMGGSARGSMDAVADAVLSSHTGGKVFPCPLAEAMTDDIVRLTPSQITHIDWILTAKLSFNDDLAGIPTSAMLELAEMAVLATKAFIFNTMFIKLDIGFIHGGMDIGAVKEIIGEYRSANEEYKAHLLKFSANSMLDPLRFQTLLKYML